MPDGVLGVATAVIGALFGAIATYTTQHFFNRARVYIEYAEIAYEDVFSLSVNTQQNIALYNAFIGYVDVQANWNFRRLLAANSFNRDELLVLQRICTTFKGHESEMLVRLETVLSMMNDSSRHEELITRLAVDYRQHFQRVIFVDYSLNPETTIQHARNLLELSKRQIELGKIYHEAFEAEIKQNLGRTERSSGRIIVRVGVANRGLRNSVLRTQALLECIGTVFKLPLLLSSRPWESDRKLSPYMSLDSKEFRVFEFSLDERQNAEADIDKFRNAAKRGTPAAFKLIGAAGNIAAKKSFRADLD